MPCKVRCAYFNLTIRLWAPDFYHMIADAGAAE